MTYIQKILAVLLFMSISVVATFKGKATIILLILLAGVVWPTSFRFKDVFDRITDQKNWKTPNYLPWLFGCFFLWGAIVLIFNDGSVKDFFFFFRLTATFSLGGLVFYLMNFLKPEDKFFLIKAFFWGFILYTIYYLIEMYGWQFVSRYHFRAGSCFAANEYLKGTVILVFLLWPALMATQIIIKKSFWTCVLRVLLFLIVLGIVWNARPDAARVCILFAGTVFFLGYYVRHISYILGSGSIVFLWISPFMFGKIVTFQSLFHLLHSMKQSHQHRLQMWFEISKIIFKNPFVGYGVNATEKIPDKLHLCIAYNQNENIPSTREVLSIVSYGWGKWVCHSEPLLGTHPHNGFFQIWLEWGLGGVILATFLCLALAKKIADIKNNMLRGILNAVFASYLVVWTVSFGIWQTWMLSLLFLTIAMILCIKGLNEKLFNDSSKCIH